MLAIELTLHAFYKKIFYHLLEEAFMQNELCAVFLLLFYINMR